MTGLENLFVHIFERKNGIIEQIKQQKESYNHHLASKLLIDGITPPPWLWNPNFHSQSSDPKELNKEELISELLFPHSRPTVPCSSGYIPLYNKTVVLGDNEELSDGLFMETHASNKGIDAGDEATTMPECRDNDVGFVLNCVPELDFSASSPQDLTDVRISNIYTAPDQSLARIQRSKSRQKALKLRNSANVASKRRLSHENNTGLSPSGIRLSRTDAQPTDHINVLFELVKPSDINRESCVSREAKEEDQSKENNTHSYFGRITRSRSSCKQPSFVNKSLILDRSFEIAKKDGGLLAESSEDSSQHCNRVNGLLEVVNSFDVTTESCGVREATTGKCRDKEKGSKVYCGRITRSTSSIQEPSSLIELSKIDASSNTAKANSGMLAQPIGKLMLQLDEANELQEVVKPSGELFGGKTSLQTSSNERMSKLVDSSSIAGCGDMYSRSDATKISLHANSLNRSGGYAVQDASGSQVIPHCSDIHVTINQEGISETVVPTELVSDGPVEAPPLCLGSNLDVVNVGIGSEGLALRPHSDCRMVVKPRQLDFYETGEHNLGNTFSPPFKKKRLEKSLEKICCTSLELAASLDNVAPDNPSQIILEKHSLVGQEASSKTDEALKHPFVVNVEEFVEDETQKYGSNIIENPMLQNTEDNSESSLHIKNSTVLHEADVALLDVHKSSSSDVERHKVNCHLTEGYQSSLELRVEEGGLGYQGRDRSENVPYTFKHNYLGPSLVSSLTKQAIGDSQGFLDKEVGMTGPADNVLDETRPGCVHSNKKLLLHEDKFDCGNRGDLPCAEKSMRERNSYLGEDALFYGSFGAPHGEDENLGSLKMGELQLSTEPSLPEMRFSSTNADSWPQFKRRKVEDQLTNCFSASPSFMAQKFYSIQGDPISRYLESVENNSDAVLEFQAVPLSHEGDVSLSNVNANSAMGTHQLMKCHLIDGTESSPRPQIEEGELGSEEINKAAETPSTFQHKQFGPSLVSSLTKQTAGDSRSCLVEDVETGDSTSNILDARNWCDGQDYQHSSHLENQKFHMREDGLLSYGSIGPQLNNDLDLIDSDQNLPGFEGFIFDAQTENGGLDIGEDGITFGKLDLPSTTTEPASIMEQICRSDSLTTPLSYFSSKFNLHRTQYLYQSVPNGLLERMDLRTTSLHNDDVGQHLRTSYSCVDENTGFHRMSYSDCLPYSGGRFGWNSKKPYTSPDGKPWGKKSLSSGSSEKRLSLNPELTCFTIEEVSSIIEENEHADEVANKIQEVAGPVETNKHAKREPLGEITEACLNQSGSVSAAEKYPDRGSLDSISTEVSIRGTHNRGRQKFRNHYRNKRSTNEAKENQNLSVGANGMKKANESLHNRFSKPKLSGKTSLMKEDQRLWERDSKHNNIVSNITSFIPLVQQKQAAAVCKGKRDIKVRALEAAEAAKRLEEKRENERKMKKESLRLERARIEQENLKQRELNKKKKEEEQKKKVADIAVRKRLREEGERKEKARKRNRIEEARRPQRLPEVKLCAGDVEKEKQCRNMDEKVNNVNKFDSGSEKNEKMEKESGDENVLKRPETEPRTTGILTSDVRQASIVNEDCVAYRDGDNGKAMNVLDKSPETGDLLTKISREKSYEISPYQCSDDEEDEEDELPIKKFIPSWASKNCVALVLPSQQKIDPDVIFPRESICSVDEVLLPGKLQLK